MSTGDSSSGISEEKTLEESAVQDTSVQAEISSTFLKESLLISKKYRKYHDILTIKLEKGKEYTIKEVDDIVASFLKQPITRAKNK